MQEKQMYFQDNRQPTRIIEMVNVNNILKTQIKYNLKASRCLRVNMDKLYQGVSAERPIKMAVYHTRIRCKPNA